MAVPEQTPYKEYIGNGVTTNFALGFTCDLKQELKVFINDIESELSTWSLTGGSVSFTTAPSSGSKIVLKRATKLERTTSYSSVNNSFRPEAINKDFDRVWYAIQDQNYKVGQYDYDYNFVLTQVRPIATGGTGANNPNDARNNLNTYSKEEVNALIATGGEGNVVGIANGGTGGTTAAEARTNLGVYSKAETDSIAATPQATETVAGKAKIATTAIVQTGTNDTDFVTPKKLKQVAFGMGAGFVDVTSSRALNTTYTNTTNKPIIVIVSCGPSGAGFSTPQMTVNGISYKGAYSQQSNMYSFNMAVVPAGGTYSVAPVGNTGVIAFWGEF